MFTNFALALDALIVAYALGATIWFFFVQSPVLIRWMGKEKFIPIQMKLTRALFASLAVALPLMLGLSFVHGYESFWLHVATAGVAVFGALVNAFIVVPRALRAGGKSMKEVRSGEESKSVSDFASRGGGEASKVWHRLVVVFVVVMLGGLVAHGHVLLSHASTTGSTVTAVHSHMPVAHEKEPQHDHAHAAADAQPAERWEANPETTANIRELQKLVGKAVATPPQTAEQLADLSKSLSAVYQQVFAQCTMTGEAHEQLHHYLEPLGGELERLAASEAGASSAHLNALQTHLQKYDTRFR